MTTITHPQPMTKILDYEITPRTVSKAKRELIAAYEEVFTLHVAVYRAALQVHNRINRERENWTDAAAALQRLWKGAKIAAATASGRAPSISFARDSFERNPRFFAYVWSSQTGERYTVERWTSYPSQYRQFEMWRCTCKDCEYKAPARNAAPTIDAPTVKYCKHIFAAAILNHLNKPAAAPAAAAPEAIKTSRRVLKAKERQELQFRTFGRGYEEEEEAAKRKEERAANDAHRDEMNSRNGKRSLAEMTDEELATWEALYEQSIKEAEELF